MFYNFQKWTKRNSFSNGIYVVCLQQFKCTFVVNTYNIVYLHERWQHFTE